jgi:hypothetical protein
LAQFELVRTVSNDSRQFRLRGLPAEQCAQITTMRGLLPNARQQLARGPPPLTTGFSSCGFAALRHRLPPLPPRAYLFSYYVSFLIVLSTRMFA